MRATEFTNRRHPPCRSSSNNFAAPTKVIQSKAAAAAAVGRNCDNNDRPSRDFENGGGRSDGLSASIGGPNRHLAPPAPAEEEEDRRADGESRAPPTAIIIIELS